MRVLVIRNAGSGGAGDVTQDRLAEALRPLGDVAFESPESDTELRRAADGRDLVVAAGGDGTLSRTVDALGGRLADVTFAVVPMGTGNDFARTLGTPEDPLEAARAIADGRERSIDVWRASGSGVERLLVNASVGGFPVEVDERVGDREKKVLGPVAYLTAGARTVASMDRFTVHLDGREVTDCLAVGVGNGRTVGGGIPLFPEADPSDGRLEACALAANGAVDVTRLGLSVRRGKHLSLDGVVTTSGDDIRIETDPPVELNVDGDLVGLRTPVEFRHAGRARFRC
ncbi:MAG: diacylglycerol/lipid kinase family protein [Actinomycetota bacterium]